MGASQAAGLYAFPARDRWQAQDYTIRFRISDFCLGSVKRQALVRQTHFTEHRGAVEEIVLPEHPAGEAGLYYVPCVPTERDLRVLEVERGLLRYCLRRYDRHFIRVAGGFEEYLEKFGSKSRNTLKRKVKNWSTRLGGDCGFRVFARAGEMEDYARWCRQISARTYQELLSGDGFPQEEEFAVRLREQAAAGLVRGYVLFEGARPVAYAHCTVPEQASGVLHYDTVGYDPEDRAWSPGTVLLYRIIEDLHGLGRFHMFDFGIGDHSYKRFFSTGSVRAADLLYLPRTAASGLLVGAHLGLAGVSRAAGKVAGWVGVAQPVKRLLRGSVR